MTDDVAALRRHAMAVSNAGPAPSRADLLERVAALAPEIEAAGDEIDRGGKVPDALQAKLVDAKLFRLLMPRALGGIEVDPVTFVHVIEAVARRDGSTAWCLCQGNGCSMVGAYLDPAVAHEIFGKDPKAILAWGPGPGRAVAADGGYRVSGSWAFASGAPHATWLGAHTPVHEPDGTPRLRDGKPVVRTVLFPAAAAPLKDIWKVVGLRGTGSNAYALDDHFVPDAYSLLRDDQTDRRDPGLLYCFPQGSLYASGFAGVALGLARGLLDAFIALALEKTPRGYKHPLAQSAVVQAKVAQAEAQLGAARLYLLSSLEEIWRSVQRTSELTLAQRMQIRLQSTWAIHQARAVGDFAYHAAGATAIFDANPFERRFRDLNTVTQQLQGREAHFETVGQFLLGLDADTTWL
ncbi:MAG TPA: acyl-CoA dehydrogenase family protein [Candidatus Sulfotelmatobacter sp.]|nr:acyl-CoA dehydrogenase family protein [Candidatus Sulfotelmatobacter sp.]